MAVSGNERILRKSKEKGIFVIHEHHASHLHWDLRLGMGGVLRSWALPKEPATSPEIKRLAVEVEDHPLEYADFEGNIPEGQYGAGEVKVWDRGTVEFESVRPEKMVFRLSGKKLEGAYVLLRFRPGKEEGKSLWLFFRKK